MLMNCEESASGLRVLIVEDDDVQAWVLEQALTSAGFRVTVATCGPAAIESAREQSFDAMLVDYNIPEIDGLGVAALLRGILGPVARPAMIALTGTPEQLCARADLASGSFDAILSKSDSLASIIKAIATCVERLPAATDRQIALDQVHNRDWEDYFSTADDDAVPDGGRRSIRILVAEDDAIYQRLVVDFLGTHHYDVDVAANGLDAIKKMAEKRYDLAIVDYHLPGIDGMAIALLVHDQMAQHRRPRLIALTGTPDVLRSRSNVKSAMFDQIVDKASGPGALIEAAQTLLLASPNPTVRRMAEHVS